MIAICLTSLPKNKVWRTNNEKYLFTYDNTTRSVTRMSDPDSIEISTTALCLGYGDGTKDFVSIPVGVNSRPMDRFRGIHNIYLYMDIVKYQIVGDASTPLLRVLPMKTHVKENQEQVSSYIFPDPHYIPVSRDYIESITMHLMTDTGEFIPFLLGKTIVKVHFRRRRPNYR